jgi:tRNA 2-(methylsulfanyl)-N6-isopentenyladenosine37 hydroxylase
MPHEPGAGAAVPEAARPAPPALPDRTSLAWARAALADPTALLEDHAHLERKAASNALALLSRRPRLPGEAPRGRRAWCRALVRIAREELQHLELVLRLLRARGGVLGASHANPYASALRRAVRAGRGVDEVVDRLLVSALIEARSCERFERLLEAGPPPDLARLYGALATAERGHHATFLGLARGLAGSGAVASRWAGWTQVERHALAAQEPGPRLFGGDPGAPVE